MPGRLKKCQVPISSFSICIKPRHVINEVQFILLTISPVHKSALRDDKGDNVV